MAKMDSGCHGLQQAGEAILCKLEKLITLERAVRTVPREGCRAGKIENKGSMDILYLEN